MGKKSGQTQGSGFTTKSWTGALWRKHVVQRIRVGMTVMTRRQTRIHAGFRIYSFI